LEPQFWSAFRQIAERRDIPINQLAAQIDRDRGVEMGLATAIRLFVLDALQSDLARLHAKLSEDVE
jgi:predicted DNA-binding ribbon-helix-helix protein